MDIKWIVGIEIAAFVGINGYFNKEITAMSTELKISLASIAISIIVASLVANLYYIREKEEEVKNSKGKKK